MKRSMLYTGIGYLAAGIGFLLLALMTEYALDPLFWGLAGGGIGPGIMMLWKYWHWTRPEHQEEYEQRMKHERINLRDERKTMLRDKSGAAVFRISLLVYPVLMLICAVLAILDIAMPLARQLLWILLLLEVLQCAMGWVIYRYLSKKL